MTTSTDASRWAGQRRLTIVTLNAAGVHDGLFTFYNPRNFRLVSNDEILVFEHDGGRAEQPMHTRTVLIKPGRTEMFGISHRYYMEGVECSPRLLAATTSKETKQ